MKNKLFFPGNKTIFMKVLHDNDKEEIQFVFHLSDIHIRLYHRLDDEYEHVFQKMYELLEESQRLNEKCLIVLTGDILHHKNDLSPECILTTLKFLNTLSYYCPTLVIAGNHDTLLNNLNRIDSLSAILAENHNPNLHYLKYSGWYRYANLVFGVSSLLDEKMTLANDLDCPQLKKIALYHGGVGKFSTHKGFVMEGIPMNTFDGYDMVMLGDIHLHQYLDKHKRIAYAGSMISQNFGETDPHHGVLKWNVSTGASFLIVLPNPYRYCEAVLKDDQTLVMDGQTYDLDHVPFPEKGRLKIFLTQKKTSDIQTLAYLRNRHPFLQFHENVLTGSSQQSPHQKTDQPSNVMAVLHEYFSTLPSDWEDKPKLMELILSFFKDNLHTKTKGASHFEIISLEFHYMFGYGPHNKIDFSQFPQHETIGIFGMNSAGKSTLIDIILFLFYGSITRYKHSQTVPPEVIHFQQKKSSGTLRFRSHNVVYEIQKKMTRSTNAKIKVEEKLFKVHPDGSKLDLSEEHRKKTDKFVISQIGPPAQFLFTNIFLQTNEQSFRSMTPKDRKDFLYDILELSQLEDHYQQNYSQWKDNKVLLDKLEKDLQTSHACPKQKEDVQQQLTNLKKKKSQYEQDLTFLQKQIRDMLSSKHPCPWTEKDVDQQIQSTKENLNKLKKETSRLKQLLAEQEKKNASPHIKPEVLEQKRNELWASIEMLYKKVQPLPSVDGSLFIWKAKCPHHPISQDVSCFRLDAYHEFMTEYHSILCGQEEDKLMLKKERLLSSLYPEADTTADTSFLENELERLREKIDAAPFTMTMERTTEKLSLLETELLALETEWQEKWEKWDQLQKEPDRIRFMSDLRFNEKCRSCSHNGSILQTCLSEAEQFQMKKKQLWETISPSKEKYSQLKQQVEEARKTLVRSQEQQKIIDRMDRVQHTIHNRSVQQQLDEIGAQQEWIRVRNAWEKVKHVAEQQKQIRENNQKMEQKIQKKKEKVAVLDQQRRLWDQVMSTQSEWKEAMVLWEKEQTKLVELEKWKQNVEENVRIDCEVRDKEDQEKKLKSKIEEMMDMLFKKQQELIILEQQLETQKKKEKEHNEIKKEQQLLTHLLHILHRDGLPMYFLEQHLPQIEDRINELIGPFLKQKKIVLRKEQKKETVNILLSVSTLGSETNYLGGMEGFIVDASIKEVLAEVSLQCKSNLFIIDEGISALDKKNMENLDQFFHFLEERHPHVFIISHLSEAQHIVRHSLQITKDGDYSKIDYV
jgi:DNA repair exonuclease SbcCD ATPase subunit